MTIEFNDREYQWTYGKTPKGRGWWWFFFEGYDFQYQGTFAEAKKACIKRIRELAPKDYDGHVIVKVGT